MRAGRFRYIRVSFWGDAAFQRLSTDARLLLLALKTGTQSTMAGINRFYMEALEQETGLTRGEVTNALAELGKAGFVVVAEGVFWVKTHLGDDPARDGDPEIRNLNHRKGIETLLGDLPKDNIAVRKFRNYYGFTRQAPTPTPPKGLRGGSAYPSASPEKISGDGEDSRRRFPETEKISDGDPRVLPSASFRPTTSTNGNGASKPTTTTGRHPNALENIRARSEMLQHVTAAHPTSAPKFIDDMVRLEERRWLQDCSSGAVDPSVPWVPPA